MDPPSEPEVPPGRPSLGGHFLSMPDVLEKKRDGHLGTWKGVLIPVCENMWGVLIFLRFYFIVGNAGIWQTAIIVLISFTSALLTTLSVSAITTNGPIEEGGTYFLVSRALGPEIGGSIGLAYYLGVTLLAVLEALGAVEVLVFSFPSLGAFAQSTRALGSLALAALTALVFLGPTAVARIGIAFFAVVLLTMLSLYIGLSAAPHPHSARETGAIAGLTGPSWETFKGNWGPGYQGGANFHTVLSIFYPCFTGILSGVDRVRSLRDPSRSLPWGTLGAVLVSMLIYSSYLGLWAAVGDRSFLLSEPAHGGGGHANVEVVAAVAWPWPKATQMGIVVASLAQALQCILTAPNLLQAIAADGAIPALKPLGLASPRNGQPLRALGATLCLALAAAMIGSLDAVAPLVSVCFLSCYTALNLSCFTLAILRAPSWRPRWRAFHWSSALAGALLCVVLMFLISWIYALVALAGLLFLYLYITHRQVEVDWGSGLGGLRLHLALQAILSLGHEALYAVNWRPRILCLVEPPSRWEGQGARGHRLLDFMAQLKKGAGLCVVTSVVEGPLTGAKEERERESELLREEVARHGVNGFVRVLMAPSYGVGKRFAVQLSGLGALETNALLLGWPSRWRESPETAEVFLETLTECQAVDKAMLVCMNLPRFPSSFERQTGYIDIWWIMHDGGLLLLLAVLLQKDKVWKGCKLRVHTVAEKLDDSELVKNNLKKLLRAVRIEAEVAVLELDDGDIAPYTYDYTLRVDAAHAYRMELKNRSKEQQSAPRPTPAEAPLAYSPLEKRENGEGSAAAAERQREHFPSEVDMVRGVVHTRRGRSGRLSFAEAASRSSVPEDVESAVRTLAETFHAASAAGPHPVTPPSLPLSSLNPTRASPTFGLPAAGGLGLKLGTTHTHTGTGTGSPLSPRSPNKLEVVVPLSSSMDNSPDGTVRKPSRWAAEDPDIVPQTGREVGPGGEGGHEGRPGNGFGTAHMMPILASRTWDTFTQAHTPEKLNNMIQEKSGNAALVIINLPDPFTGMAAGSYLEYCETLARGLKRTVLVHGTGKEIWSTTTA